MSFYIERFIPKLVPVKDTLRVRRRGTSSFDTPVVTGLGQGARQKILIHQVFNRSVKVWARCEGLFHPHVPCPLSVWNELVRKGKPSWLLRTGRRKKFERIRINLSHLDLVSGLCQGSRTFPALEPWHISSPVFPSKEGVSVKE